jgi:hypothetical protein
VFGKNDGIKRSFVICVAAACLVQGGYKVLSLLFIISEREVSVFRIIGSTRGPVGSLVQAAYQ